MAGLLLGKCALPYDPVPVAEPSGIRLGTGTVTSQGMGKPELAEISGLIPRVLTARHPTTDRRHTRPRIRSQPGRLPTPLPATTRHHTGRPPGDRTTPNHPTTTNTPHLAREVGPTDFSRTRPTHTTAPHNRRPPRHTRSTLPTSHTTAHHRAAAGLLLGKCALPYDPAPVAEPSGIRLGTGTVTSQGMGKPELAEISGLIPRVLTRAPPHPQHPPHKKSAGPTSHTTAPASGHRKADRPPSQQPTAHCPREKSALPTSHTARPVDTTAPHKDRPARHTHNNQHPAPRKRSTRRTG
nr:hypothetical protein KitaXyl93_62380 [Kitasatospora sp. Xyl93]